VPTVIHVERQAGSWCSDVLSIPALGIEVHLPPVAPVHVELPALAPGRYEITCGLQMLRGAMEVGRADTLTGTELDARDVEGADRTCERDRGGPRRRAS
jgi:plastocyanin domain-containing protein